MVNQNMMRNRFDELCELEGTAETRSELFGMFTDEELDEALALICPRCCQMIPTNQMVGEYVGALSRVIEQYICSDCGNVEGLESMVLGKSKPIDRWFYRVLSLDDILILVNHIKIHREVAKMIVWQQENPDGDYSLHLESLKTESATTPL